MQSEIRASFIIWSVNESPCSRRSDSRAGSFLFFCLREFFSSALLSERLEQAKRLVNEYMCSMNYYDYYGLFYCCNYFN